MLRYHLWDIDVVINRTLVYGTLTAMLALVYFGSVVLLQHMFYAFTGQSSLLAIVASTLAIALLFQPLRHGIQFVIDRRFYHHKYDAEQALASFSARLQQNEEVNLSTLSDDLLDSVEQTLQPAHVSFWLCNSPDHEEAAEIGEIEIDTVWNNEPQVTSIVREQCIAPSRPSALSRRSIVFQAQWLPYARLLWLLVATLTAVLFIIALPAHTAHMHIVCADIMCAGTQSTSEVARQLHSLGISLYFYTAYILIVQILFALGYCIVAAVIFFRTWGKSTEPRIQWMAFLVSLFFVTFVLAFTDAPAVLTRSYPALSLPLACLGFIGETSLPLCFYLLPDGQFVPRWTRWLLPGWIAWGVLWYFFPNVPFKSNVWFLLLEDGVFMGGLGSMVFAQIYRYRYVSDPAQRQQTKWVVFGMATGLGGFFGAGMLGFVVPHALLPLLAPSAQASTYISTVAGIIAITASYLAMLLVPLTICFAIHRYRLWDVDALVSQTLIYSTLIGLLGLIFLASVITQERLLQALIGRASELVIVGSTLAIVLLFQPLRHGIQSAIHRRLYRHKYVIEHALASFSTTLRDKANLEQLSEDVMEVVEETMRPEQASLWLLQQLQSDAKAESVHFTRHVRTSQHVIGSFQNYGYTSTKGTAYTE